MRFKNFLLYSLIFFGIASCSKKNNEEPQKKLPDVYIATDFGSTVYSTAGYLVNGDRVVNVGGPWSTSTDIAVEGSDVYLAGQSYGKATVWKNGNVYFTDPVGSTIISAIAVKDNNVYFAGTYNNRATLWTNGVATPLRAGTSSAAAICLQGVDVYVAGTVEVSGKDVACYWKNGNEFLFTNESYNPVVKGLFVTGTDVYISGFNNNSQPAYWKNGKITKLQVEVPNNFSAQFIVGGIAVSGADVYVVGSANYTRNPTYYGLPLPQSAQYWKNGNLEKSKDLYGATIDIIMNPDFTYVLKDIGCLINGQQMLVPQGAYSKAIFITK